ncbi:hypothetical protein HYY75_03340 [bacterium]|nr:hypothetical protein [bacterium]
MAEICVSVEQLERMNKIHRLELRKIRKMNERQFQTFKKNFSFGHLEKITKIEAEELLTSMLTLNLKMQSELSGKKIEC